MLMDAYPKTVTLKDGRNVVLRPLAEDDSDRLHAFFVSLPDEDRLFLRDNVTDPDLIRRWTSERDFNKVLPLVALDGDRIVADGTLHAGTTGWTQHVAQLRLVTARSHRHVGLGVLIAHDLVAMAAERNIEKIQAKIIEQDIGAMKMLVAVGFERMAVLKDMVRDQHGDNRDLVIMVNDVCNLNRIMDDWIQDSMVPAFRVPGDGA